MKTYLLRIVFFMFAIGLVIGLLTTGASAIQVVRFLHNETDPPSIKFFNKAIKEFEAANPDIKIEMEAVSTDGRLQKVMASLNARTMPELFKILPEERYDFAKKGYLVPLDDLLKKTGESDFTPESLIRIDGVVYDLPYTLGNFSVFWYREDLLKAKRISPPKNWDELKAAAKALTEKPDMFGFVFPAGKNRMTSIFFSTMMWSAGGTYFDKNLNVTFDNPAAIKALNFLKELAPYCPAGIGSYSYSDMITVYLSGKLAMDIYAPRVIANLATTRKDLLPMTKSAPTPVGPTGVGVKFVNSNSFAIAKPEMGGKNTEAAKKFLEFIITGERSREFSLTAFPHLIPPLKSIQKSEAFLSGDPILKDRKDLASAAFNTSNSLEFDTEAGAVIEKGTVKSSGIFNPYIGPIIARGIPADVVQKVILENQPPAEVVKWGANEMRRIVNELKRK